MVAETLEDAVAARPKPASITYVLRTSEKPYVHTAALTGGLPRYFAEMEVRDVAVRDARPLAGRLSMEREGFELVRHHSGVRDFYDEGEVKTHYYPEIENVLKLHTGAREVLIFDHTRRTDELDSAGSREPAVRAHNDYTERSAPQRLQELTGPERARILTAGPWAQINAWRPITGPVLRMPLALLDASSLGADDLVATDQIYPDRVGEIYHLAHNPAHRWFCFPRMERDELVLIKGYDSRTDGRARFTPHIAFVDPGTPPDAPARESIEIRAFVFFDRGRP